jgi:internalin A
MTDSQSLIFDNFKSKDPELNLAGHGLTELPESLVHHQHLKRIILDDNLFTKVPDVLFHMNFLDELHMRNNKIQFVPPHISDLENLRVLKFGGNSEITISNGLFRLRNLIVLDLGGCKIPKIDPSIESLTNLEKLFIPYNELSTLPTELFTLNRLHELDAGFNQIISIPDKIGKLDNLSVLKIHGNQLTQLPSDMDCLHNLTVLFIYHNRLTHIPSTLFELPNLRELDIGFNQLTALPIHDQIQSNIEILKIHKNQFRHIPPSISAFRKLKQFHLYDNPIAHLPLEIGEMSGLEELQVSTHLLMDPPAEIVHRGTGALKAYLSGCKTGYTHSRISKVLIVGPAGCGKTSLSRALLGQPFIEGLHSTHEIKHELLPLSHNGESIRLNLWDFGDNEIIHSLHQAFFSDRSIVLLVWNARQGCSNCNVNNWRELINRLIPNSIVFSVATHTDFLERDGTIPSHEGVHKIFPVSNKTGEGIEQLKQALIETTIHPDHSHKKIPNKWVNLVRDLEKRPDHYLYIGEIYRLSKEQYCIDNPEVVHMLHWMNEIGMFVYLGDYPELQDIVILHPDWLTSTIYELLNHKTVRENHGIVSQETLRSLWSHIDVNLWKDILWIMQRFDLLYFMPGESDSYRCQITTLLPDSIPEVDKKFWDKQAARENQMILRFAYTYKSQTCGLLTRLLAHIPPHRLGGHGQHGAILKGDIPSNQIAILEETKTKDRLELSVAGRFPYDLLMSTIGTIEHIGQRNKIHLNKFVHCSNPNCNFEFLFDDIIYNARYSPSIQCPRCRQAVDIQKILFGWSRDGVDTSCKNLDEIEGQIQDLHKSDLRLTKTQDKITQLTGDFRDNLAYIQRQFISTYGHIVLEDHSHCPYVFSLLPKGGHLLTNKLELTLFCQSPKGWHPVEKGGRYTIHQPADWLERFASYLIRMLKIIKYCSPLTDPILGLISSSLQENNQNLNKLLEELSKKVDFSVDNYLQYESDIFKRRNQIEIALGQQFRLLAKMVKQLDEESGGGLGDLNCVKLSDGAYIWVCSKCLHLIKKP